MQKGNVPRYYSWFICHHLLPWVGNTHKSQCFGFSRVICFFLIYPIIIESTKEWTLIIWFGYVNNNLQIATFFSISPSTPKKVSNACKISMRHISYILSALYSALKTDNNQNKKKQAVYLPLWTASSLLAGTSLSSSLGHRWPAQHLRYNVYP